MVTWKDKKGNLMGERYYYVFKKDELENLINDSVTIVSHFMNSGTGELS